MNHNKIGTKTTNPTQPKLIKKYNIEDKDKNKETKNNPERPKYV